MGNGEILLCVATPPKYFSSNFLTLGYSEPPKCIILWQFMNIHNPPESYKRGKISGLAVSRHPTAKECRPLHRNALRAVSTTTAAATTASATTSELEFSLVAGPVNILCGD